MNFSSVRLYRSITSRTAPIISYKSEYIQGCTFDFAKNDIAFITLSAMNSPVGSGKAASTGVSTCLVRLLRLELESAGSGTDAGAEGSTWAEAGAVAAVVVLLVLLVIYTITSFS